MSKKMNKKIALILISLVMVSSSGSSFGATGQPLVIPVLKNPIINNSTLVGFSILSVNVQDNTDPKSGKPIADRLDIRVRNSTAKAISSFNIFYTMVDQVTKASESYFQKLTHFSVRAKSIGYIAFDGAKGFGHFPENSYSIYRNSLNVVKFTIELSALGFKPQIAKATKDKGTTENPNA